MVIIYKEKNRHNQHAGYNFFFKVSLGYINSDRITLELKIMERSCLSGWLIYQHRDRLMHIDRQARE